ncbi:hypothetical protein [Paenibacillus sp. YN15]|uniref:hypothetical protein n=1 Tax=Paenibacillus sp. YN15 TaxID=1742774 RepID=UPI000DCC5227|nr:hypothetical protein [Paenibacillus sp. YN15]RAU93559.1 hypothetical protein DQG13_25395 [Paenibacillus sp. YN15]
MDEQRIITDRTVSLLEQMDGLFDGFFGWLKGQYDSESGGFFYARSSRSMNQLPDIESSSQALNILERVGLLEGWDATKKEQAIRFFQNKQDPASGYFYEENPDMRGDDVMVGRALSYSVASLRKLGGAPLYPLPSQTNSMPDYMDSPDSYEAWLNAMPLTNSWRGCDRLCNSAPYIGQLPEAAQEEYLKRAFAFFARIQDPETGLWGEGSGYVRISGSFKLETFYSRFRMPMPRGEALYRSILRILREETARDMCYIRNPVNLLGYLRPQIPPEEFEEIVEITVRNMGRLLQADGGFSRELGHSPKATNVAQVKEGEYYPDMPKAVPIGLGLAEGDMNAGTQVLLIRSICYELAGFVPPELDTSAWK